MLLLVTRPEPDASRTAERLRAMGHQALVQPLLVVTFSVPPADLPTPAAIIVTSQNGARALGRWPQRMAWLAKPVFTAGPATGRTVAALGFTNVHDEARDSGSLGEAVLRTLRKDAGPLVYPAARDRAGVLPEQLIAGGYDVHTIEAYQADPVARFDAAAREALVSGSIEGILLYSRRTASSLLAHAAAEGIAQRLAAPAYYVISENVAKAIRGLGARILVAKYPDEDSLLALIPRPR